MTLFAKSYASQPGNEVHHHYSPSDQELDWLREDLISWFSISGRSFPWREKSTSLYEHIISEILLQHTKAEKVSRIFGQFCRKFRSWEDLANADILDIEEAIRPLGLWRRRAAYFQKLAMAIIENRGEIPTSYGDLRQLPGVGQYVANAILVFQGVSRAPLLDRGVGRVLTRLYDTNVQGDICNDPDVKELAYRIVDCDGSIKISWALLDLSALICKVRNPLCDNCPVADQCNSSLRFGCYES